MANGIFRCGPRYLKGMIGWYHFGDFANALAYAHDEDIGFELGKWRFVLEVQTKCSNSCHGGRTWQYTQEKCMRYSIVAVRCVSAAHRFDYK